MRDSGLDPYGTAIVLAGASRGHSLDWSSGWFRVEDWTLVDHLGDGYFFVTPRKRYTAAEAAFEGERTERCRSYNTVLEALDGLFVGGANVGHSVPAEVGCPVSFGDRV